MDDLPPIVIAEDAPAEPEIVENSDMEPVDPLVLEPQAETKSMLPVPTYDQVVELAEHLDLPGASPVDLLLAALIAEKVDPILARIRGRKQVLDLLTHLSTSIGALTHIASLLNIHEDGKPVEESTSFIEWPQDRLRTLATHLACFAASLSIKSNDSMELVQKADARHEADQAMIKKLIDQANEAKSLMDHQRTESLKTILRLNTLLTSHVDMPLFTVARIDSVTGKPLRFFAETEESLHTGPFETATLYSKYQEAHDIRVEVLKSLRGKLKKAERELVSDSVAVLQVSLRAVSLADSDETED